MHERSGGKSQYGKREGARYRRTPEAGLTEHLDSVDSKDNQPKFDVIISIYKFRKTHNYIFVRFGTRSCSLKNVVVLVLGNVESKEKKMCSRYFLSVVFEYMYF